MNKPIVQIIISIVLVILLILGAYFIVMRKPINNKNQIDNISTNSNIVSTDPKVSAAKFIEANGAMGSVEIDITQDSMKTNEATYMNGTRRLTSLAKVEQAVVPGNKLIIGNERDNLKRFVGNLDYPFLYKIDNISVSEPSNPAKLTVYSESNAIEYQSVKVFVDFESTRIHYTCPKDVTYAGIHTQFSNTEKFKDIEVILVQSGELWFVYDIVNSEQLINERFATWSGAGVSTIDYDKNKETGIFTLDNFVPIVTNENLEVEDVDKNK